MENTKNTEAEELSQFDNLAGKYLTFNLAEEVYGLEIIKVQEINGLMPITRIPNVPDYVRGVINLRGRIIPTVELRMKFGLEPIEDTDRTCIIVVEVVGARGKLSVGVIVDEVAEVLDIQGKDINPPPDFGSDLENGYILGVAIAGEGVKVLLNIDRVLTATDLDSMRSIADADFAA